MYNIISEKGKVYNIINESLNHSNQFISVKVKKKLRKSQAQFWEMLRKLRLRQNNDFLIKKTCMYIFIYVCIYLPIYQSVESAERLQIPWVKVGKQIPSLRMKRAENCRV